MRGCEHEQSPPKSYGNWHTVYVRTNRRSKNGVLQHLFEGLQQKFIWLPHLTCGCFLLTLKRKCRRWTGRMKIVKSYSSWQSSSPSDYGSSLWRRQSPSSGDQSRIYSGCSSEAEQEIPLGIWQGTLWTKKYGRTLFPANQALPQNFHSPWQVGYHIFRIHFICHDHRCNSVNMLQILWKLASFFFELISSACVC